jgi:hypothetical protein
LFNKLFLMGDVVEINLNDVVFAGDQPVSDFALVDIQ